MTTPPITPTDIARQPRVLVVDNDRDIAELVEAVLDDASYDVSLLYQLDSEVVAAAVGRLEPDCVLLDGSGPEPGYGDSWALAERLTVRGRPVPVVMFTAHRDASREATEQTSVRSQAAHFAAVLEKPFDIEVLLDAVAQAVGVSVPFDRSAAADALRTQVLVERLRGAGATEIHRSTRREWVTFRNPAGHLVQLYWWQALGLYLCGAYEEQGAVMQPIGRFAELDAAVTCSLTG